MVLEARLDVVDAFGRQGSCEATGMRIAGRGEDVFSGSSSCCWSEKNIVQGMLTRG